MDSTSTSLIVMLIGGFLAGSSHALINVVRGNALRQMWREDPEWVENQIGHKEVKRLRDRVHAPKSFEGNNWIHSVLSSGKWTDAYVVKLSRQYRILWVARIAGVLIFLLAFFLPELIA